MKGVVLYSVGRAGLSPSRGSPVSVGRTVGERGSPVSVGTGGDCGWKG